MPRSAQLRNSDSSSKRASAPATRASSFRLLPLLLAGLVLIGASWWFRSSRGMREAILRGKELPELQAIVHDHPDDSIAQYYLAKRYYLNRRFPEARDAYQQVTRLEPRSARAHLGLGLTLYELRDISRAQSELEETLRLDNRSAWAEYMLGKIAWSQGDIAGALPHVKRATELDPRTDQAWYGLGACYAQLHRQSEALDAMQQAAARNGANPRYQTAVGELLVALDRPDDGRRHYERALQIDPNYGPTNALLGSWYLHKSQEENALDRAEQLLEHAARLPTYRPQDVYRDLGELYLKKRNYPAAIDALQNAIRRAPRDEQAYYLLTKVYRSKGDTRAAEAAEAQFKFFSDRHISRDALEARLRHNPNDAPGRLNLARIYRDLGLAQQAAQQYLFYRRLNPGATAIRDEFNQFMEQQAEAARSGLNQDFALPPLR